MAAEQSERAQRLAARIDAYMLDAEDDDEADGAGRVTTAGPEVRDTSPSIEIDMPELKPRSSGGEIAARPSASSPAVDVGGSIQVNLGESEPDPSGGPPPPDAATSSNTVDDEPEVVMTVTEDAPLARPSGSNPDDDEPEVVVSVTEDAPPDAATSSSTVDDEPEVVMTVTEHAPPARPSGSIPVDVDAEVFMSATEGAPPDRPSGSIPVDVDAEVFMSATEGAPPDRPSGSIPVDVDADAEAVLSATEGAPPARPSGSIPLDLDADAEVILSVTEGAPAARPSGSIPLDLDADAEIVEAILEGAQASDDGASAEQGADAAGSRALTHSASAPSSRPLLAPAIPPRPAGPPMPPPTPRAAIPTLPRLPAIRPPTIPPVLRRTSPGVGAVAPAIPGRALGGEGAAPPWPSRATSPSSEQRQEPDPAWDGVLAGLPELADLPPAGDATATSPAAVMAPPLETYLDTPTALEGAIEASSAGVQARADALRQQLEAMVVSDPTAAAILAYELGEVYERRLADAAQAARAFDRALALDASLRSNLWAIRRVFYQRALWPNLLELIDAEMPYARDDHERADLLLEKARVQAYRIGELGDARESIEEAARLAPAHQGVLLELERIVTRRGDVAGSLDAWERLADAVDHPGRKVAYLIEAARAAGSGGDVPRARAAFERATAIVDAAGDLATAERIAREQLRIAEEHGSPEDTVAAAEALAGVLMAAFGPAGPAPATVQVAPGERPTREAALRLELVALRRRQAQVVRTEQPTRAWELLQAALTLSPGEPIVLADLTDLAEQLGRYEDLAALVQTWEAVEGDSARSVTLAVRRIDALLRGGHAAEARERIEALAATAPGFIALTSASEREALGRLDTRALAATYLAAASAALLGTWTGPGQALRPAPQAAAALWVQAAELLAHEVATSEAADEAREALGKALEAVPGYPAAVEALIELDDLSGRTSDALARVRQAAAAMEDPAARQSLVERGIRIARSHGDFEAVVGFQRELVAARPGDMSARWRLEATLAHLGRDQERGELLEQIAADEADATGRGTALLAAARLREYTGELSAATELYRRALEVWPRDGYAHQSLVDLLRAQERWLELVAARQQEAADLPDGSAARAALSEAAWVLETRARDDARAAEAYAGWLARFPDDRAALEGQARCAARLGDHERAVAARGALAELEPGPTGRLLHARSLERAGRIEEATALYRDLAANEAASLESVSAARALADIAAHDANPVLHVEATAALAGQSEDPRLAAAFAEEAGWTYALVLDDLERAVQSFAAATALDPGARGAHLGAALVAARRNDPVALAGAYQGLAAAIDMPEAAAALLLRGAAMAAARNDLELANQRVASAHAIAPDDAGTLLVIAEVSATPVVDDPGADPYLLLARADALETRGALADDPAAAASWELDRAEAFELAGRLRDAGVAVSAVLATRPDDVRALTTLQRLARRAGDRRTAASASYALARVLGDASARLELLREAAAVYDDQSDSGQAEFAIATYQRILQIDPGARELHRLLALLREKADRATMIAVLSTRISVRDIDGDPDAEAVALLLERATLLHDAGDADAAAADLDALLAREASHLAALRFRADLAINAGDVTLAVDLWRRYLGSEQRPERRKEVELQLAQVLAESANDLDGAIASIGRVVEANPDDVLLRERLLGLCIRASDWSRAARELTSLAGLRDTPHERAREELRLGLLLRDRLNDRAGARLALERARGLDATNLDVLRELGDLLEPAARARLLEEAAAGFRGALRDASTRTTLYEKLAQVAAWQGDVDGRWLSLVAVEAVAMPSSEHRQVLASGRTQLVGPTGGRLEAAARDLVYGDLGGPLLELWRTIAPAVQLATGVDASKLGFARGDRVAVKKLGDRYEALATALAIFGVEDVDVYVSATRTGVARALSAEVPVLCLGADVASAASASARFLLGRAVATLAGGVATLPELRDGELTWTVAAALRAVEARVPSELVVADETGVEERAKLLKKELGRKQKSAVLAVAQAHPTALSNSEAFRRQAIAAGHRAGLVWAGDLAVALAALDLGKGGRAVTDSTAALELVAWSVSSEHRKLRDLLKIALKGGR